MNFHASSCFMLLHRPVCVGPVRKPYCWFSNEAAQGVAVIVFNDLLIVPTQSRSRGYKLFLCSAQLTLKFILLINVKMPTIIGILTFISTIN